MDGLGIVSVRFPCASHLVASYAVQRQIHVQPQRIKGLCMERICLFCDIIQCDASHPADGIREVFIDHALIDTDRLKDLGALIRLNGGNTHLGSDLYNSVKHG